MLETRSPWWARIPMIGNLGAPIIRKEVFSLVRRNRWFWAQFIYLLVLAAGMAIIYASNSTFSLPPEILGARLVNKFFTLQIGLVCLIFPGLASTSISAERVEKSFDLLVVSDLTPAELVWGKLLGILGSAFYFLVSTLPILGVCIFFGGLSPVAILVDYSFLFMLAIVVSAWGILISAMSRNNLLSIIGTYALALFLGFWSCMMFSEVLPQNGARGLLDAYQMANASARGYVLWSILTAFTSFIMVSLIGASFFLSSPESNRGTPMRIFITLSVLGGIIFANSTIAMIGASGPITPNQLADIGPPSLVFAACLMMLVLVGLAGSRVETPLRAVRLASLRPKRWYAAWPVIGGGVRGVFLACGLLVFGLFSLESLFLNTIDTLSLPSSAGAGTVASWKGAAFTTVFPWVTQLLAVWVFAFLGLAFFLSTVGLRGGINWFLTIGVSILLILLSIGRLATRPPSEYESMTMFSPIVTIVGHFNSRRFPVGGPELDATFTGYWIAGVLLIAAGIVSMKMQGLPLFVLRRPGYDFLIERAQPQTAASEPSDLGALATEEGDSESEIAAAATAIDPDDGSPTSGS